MTLGRLCPNVFKEFRRRQKLERKAAQIEIAWRKHEKKQGVRHTTPFEIAVKKNLVILMS